jgi:predicted MFS family arabinose efflux permease
MRVFQDDFQIGRPFQERPQPVVETAPSSPVVGRATTLVMAVGCGVAAATLYANQPMLGLMEAAFPGQIWITDLVPMAAQLGFAVGLLLLVPLGDRIDRRRLILLQMTALAFSLVAAALAPDAWALVVISALVGITSSVAQQIVPFATELAEPSRRGPTIGIVMSGLLCGMLLGRVVAGGVADHYGWRAMYWLSLLLVIATSCLLAATLPQGQAKTRAGYGELLKSLIALWRDEPALRRATMIQGCLFGSFTAFWIILALQLGARYHLGAETAGLFGIAGMVGILFAPIAGKIGDRRGPAHLVAVGTLIMLASWCTFAASATVSGLIVGVILLDFGEQGALVSNQRVIYALRPEARSRPNTIFMGGMFVGGAIGSAGAVLVWHMGGWYAVCALGDALVAIALALVWSAAD